MTNPAKEISDHLGMLRDFPLNELGKDNVEDLWRQLLSYRSSAPNDLAEAKAHRTQAEAAREKAVLDAVRNTQLVCERNRANAEKDLQEAKAIKEGMLRAKQEAESELQRARSHREQAEQEAQRIVSEAKGAAQDIISQARMASQREADEFRQAVLIEIKHLLGRAENMSAAIAEELETQRILSSMARISSNTEVLVAEASNSSLDALRIELGAAPKTAGSQPDAPQSANGPVQKSGLENGLQEALQKLIGSIESSERAEFQRGSLRDLSPSNHSQDKGPLA